VVQSLPVSYALNRELNDMGLIHLRHGEPATTVSSPGKSISELRQDPTEPSDYSSAIESSLSPACEWWLYPAVGNTPGAIHHFACLNRGENFWALTVLPPDPEQIANIRAWDPRYALLDRFPDTRSKLETEEQHRIADGLRTDNQSWPTTTAAIAVPHAIESFRADDGKTLLDMSYAIPLGALREHLSGKQSTVSVEVGLSVYSFSSDRARNRLDTLQLPFDRTTQGSNVSLYRLVLSPDSLRVAMHVRSLDERVMGGWSEELRVPPYPKRDFAVSDLQLLLPATGRPSIEVEGERVVQSPFRAYRRNATVFCFAKLYGLIRDTAGKVRWSVVCTLVPVDTGGSRETVSLGSVTWENTDTDQQVFQRLDLHAVPPGRYRLSAALTDRLRVETLTRSTLIGILP
jgi:hypothetical protein